MFGSLRKRLALAAVLGLALSPLGGAGAARGADDDNFKRVPIPTFDGVKLEGTYYPNATGKKDACVLLLHNFDRHKGGDSHADGWDHLAKELQKKGYAVLSFDFRGFGQSKTLESKEKFWSAPHNRDLRGAEVGKSETIDHKKFPPQYYPTLVNDIAAAKAFLDRLNDGGQVNTSNLIVIGAGEGAALGALWLASEAHLQRDRDSFNKALLLLPAVPLRPLDDPEIKDVAAAVWLSLSPSVAGIRMPLSSALQEVGRENKVPMAFVYGSKDGKSASITKAALNHIRGSRKDLKLTGEKPLDSELVGSKLLQDTLDTEKWIIESYLDPVMENRGAPARKVRDTDKYRYFYAFPKPGPGAHLVPSKNPNEEHQGPIPLKELGVGAP
jgi:alpha-beta hydrolase superfamily lysophospholipase